jgi:hypothetical protein
MTETRLGAISKNQATVHTATVDVKIMRLGKKQVTLSVFRRIHQKSILRPGKLKPSLRGIPWGRVNYTWKGNEEFVAYHIVWERNSRLFRMGLPVIETLDCKGRIYATMGGGFFRAIGLKEMWRNHENREYSDADLKELGLEIDPELTKSFELYAAQLQAFEQLDQLFIAV